MLSYNVTGSLNLPPLLFLHGFLGVKEDWDEIIAPLKEKFRCYAFDLPGHGSSSFHPHLLESVFSTILSLKIPPSPLIGYSMGGRLALFLKQHFPKHFQSLVLLSAHPGLKVPSEKRARLQQDLNWCERLETEPLESFLKDWYSQPLFDSLKKNAILYEKILQRRLKQNPKNMAEILRNFSLALQPAVERFDAKTLFLYGEEDLKFADVYCTLPPHVKVKKISRSGHFLIAENPGEVANEISAFLEA
jgi:2-succinyl-6-hydroxy-2,4-cyclohexadiene-1-carboxylate synthase